MSFWGGTTRTEGPPPVSVDMEPEMEAGFDSLPDTPRVPPTVIARGITFAGELTGEGVIEVDGTVEGGIHLQGTVNVNPTGTVQGPIDATDVEVAGFVEGSVIAHNHILLKKTGVITGDVTTTSFTIEDGGWFNGRTTMKKPKKKR